MGRQIFGLAEAEPFSTQDKEIARLNAFFEALRPEQWKAPIPN
jgi:hypothetical protein